jgi:hypothetical protein
LELPLDTAQDKPPGVPKCAKKSHRLIL